MHQLKKSVHGFLIGEYMCSHNFGKLQAIRGVCCQRKMDYRQRVKARRKKPLIRPHYTEEDLATIRRMYSNREPLKNIAAEFNRPLGSISTVIKRLGIASRNLEYSEAEISEIVELYNNGARVKEIAVKFNRSVSAMAARITILRKQGVQLKYRRKKHGDKI